MNKKYALVAFALLCALSLPASGQVLSELSLPPNGDNSRATVSQWIGPVKVTIDYHSPNVHGRVAQTMNRGAPLKRSLCGIRGCEEYTAPVPRNLKRF